MVRAAYQEAAGALAGAGPLYEYVLSSRLRKNRPFHRALLLVRVALFLLFVAYRVHTLLGTRRCTEEAAGGDELCRFNGELGVAALICEVWFCVSVILAMSSRWWLVERVTHPDQLLKRIDDLPAVDVFVTTADPTKEPPLVTMNTILSVLTMDYPTCKLACYLSDDGGSLLTLWSFKKTATFARQSWLPFCTKFLPHVRPRTPGRYFACKQSLDDAIKYNFAEEWHDVKGKYDALAVKINSMSAAYSKSPFHTLQVLMQELKASSTSKHDLSTYDSWASNFDPHNHGSHCEILSSKLPGTPNFEFPFLVYLSRQKDPTKKHHFKAGAMNALLRVSGIMTNAPFVMNLDCDMYVNAPNALLEAMCIFMEDTKKGVGDNTGFVQFPQCFEGVDKDDVYGASLTAAIEIFIKGMDGVQGPPYCGTGCVHKRVSLYGWSPQLDACHTLAVGQKLGDIFGCSQILINSIQELLLHVQGTSLSSSTNNAPLVEANALMDCNFEEGTGWGKEVGLIYGSLTEDILTGLRIHGRGWKSIACTPHPPAFLGCIPSTSEDALTTRKRWSIGELEILFSSNSPLVLKKSLGMSLMQRIIYLYICNTVLIGLPMFVYSLLPALSLLKQSPIFPEVIEMSILVPLSAAAFMHIINMYENKIVGIGLQMWWNTERMEYLVAISSSILASCELLMKKVMRTTEITFTITPKDKHMQSNIHNDLGAEDQEQGQDQEQGFEVNSTQPIFILPTILVLFNLVALLVACFHIFKSCLSLRLCFPSEVACSMWILFLLFPFTKGFFLWLVGQSGRFALSSWIVFHALPIVLACTLFITLI